MTLLVASLTAATTDALIASAAGVEADILELRLDALASVTRKDLETLRARITQPLLATCRHPDEGGAWKGAEDARLSVLNDAIAAGFEYVDVERAAPGADALIAAASARGARVILSSHDFVGTPPRDALVALLEEADARGAWCGKVATTMTSPRDAEALVLAAKDASEHGLTFALMATNDPVLRLTAPALGIALAYVNAGTGPATAPGQVTLAAARTAHAAFIPSPRASTRAVYIFGHPVAHSRSPAFQNAAFQASGVDAVYLASDVAPAELPHAIAALRALGALGANITVPHKETVIPLLDALDDSARAAGAVNTIVNRDGALVGFNTDGAGALDALAQARVKVAGARALVLGAGGAARGIVGALVAAGARVTLANRTGARADALGRELGAAVVDWDARDASARDADILINTTIIGMTGDALPLAASTLRRGLAVFDAVYREGDTPLIGAARALGAAVVPGESMLLHQGARAFTLWTGRPAPLGVMRGALRAGGDPS